MARGDQLGRQWRMIQTLLSSTQGISVAYLADELECHPRTVYRDLEALQIAGFPIYNERVDGKSLWSVLDTVKKHFPIPLTLTELMALYFSRDMVKVLHDTVFYESLESLFQKIKTTLPPESITFLQNIQQTLHVSLKQYKEYGRHQKIIAMVQEAAIRKITIKIIYYTMSRRKQSARSVDPYKIWFFSGTFYLVGYCHMRRGIRIFALDRIKSVHLTDDTFTVPDDFSMEALMGSSFGVFPGKAGLVRIRFDREIAGYITEKIWHASQKIYRQDDGAIVFEAQFAITDEVKFWILSWGARAEVLEPETLRSELQAEAGGIVEKYAGTVNSKQ